MHTFKNTHASTPYGVNTKDGQTIYVQPGKTSPPLDVAKGEVEHLKKSTYFEVAATSDHVEEASLPDKTVEDGSIQNSTAHREGNEVKTGGDAQVEDADEDDDAPDYEALTDEELRAFITDRDGKAPHPNTGRPKLLATAKGSAEQEAV